MNLEKLQCSDCQRKRGCMVRPNGLTPCPYHTPYSDISFPVAFLVGIGIGAAAVLGGLMFYA